MSHTSSIRVEKGIMGLKDMEENRVQKSAKGVAEDTEHTIDEAENAKQISLSFPPSLKNQSLHLPEADATGLPDSKKRGNYTTKEISQSHQRNWGDSFHVMENLISCFSSKEKSIDDFADEYHKKNQRFLEKAMKNKERIPLSQHPLSTPHTMRDYQSHQPPTKPIRPGSIVRSKKVLSAISDNDDWGYSRSDSSKEKQEEQRLSDQEKKVPHNMKPPLSQATTRPKKKGPPTSYGSLDTPHRENLGPEGDPTSPVRLFISDKRHESGSRVDTSHDDPQHERTPSGDSTAEKNPKYKQHRRNPTWDLEFDQITSPKNHRRASSGNSTGEKDDVAPPPPSQPPRIDIEEELKRISHRYPTPPRKKKENKKQKKKKKKRRRKHSSLYSSPGKSEAVQVRENRKQQRKRRNRKKDEQVMWKEYMMELEKEKEDLVAIWKEQYAAEQTRLESEMRAEQLSNFKTNIVCKAKNTVWTAEIFFANLPSTLGALGFSWMMMGVVWFQVMEANNDVCKSSQPCIMSSDMFGCHECDTTTDIYIKALKFHNMCDIIAGLTVMGIFLKCIFAWRVVADELSNPTTASPFGLVCMTLVRLLGEYERVGGIIAVLGAAIHFFLACWFLYISIVKFRALPDPSWFPNTVGIAHAAIQCRLYCPKIGDYLVLLSVVFFIGTFFISLFRVAWNHKISSLVCWIQLCAPSLTLVGVASIAQSALQDQSGRYQKYLQLLIQTVHILFGLSLISMVSCIHSWCIRLESFSKINQFTPAHMAFCFPLLSHTYSVQVYRNMIDVLLSSSSTITSTLPPMSNNKFNSYYYPNILYTYWMILLISGTVMTLMMSMKFIFHLPQWTSMMHSTIYAQVEEPPDPQDTVVHQLLKETKVHEVLRQPFVSPAILQVNEQGILVRLRKGTETYNRLGPYVRTRHCVPSFGFDPCMNMNDVAREHAVLLDWMARNDIMTTASSSIRIRLGCAPLSTVSDETSPLSSNCRRSTLMGELEPLQRILNERTPWAMV